MKVVLEKRDLQDILLLDYETYKDYNILTILKNMPEDKKGCNIYFVNKKNNEEEIITFIDKNTILNLFIEKNDFSLKVKDLKPYNNIPVIYNDENLLYIYNLMRNKYDFVPVKNKKNGKLIGELHYITISKKFYDILLKMPNFNTYNEEVLKLLSDKYKELFENINIGIIAIKPANLSIMKNFYGNKFVNEFLIILSNRIINTLRRIDMTFWYNNTFYLITFNVNKKILPNIIKRIQKNINDIEFKNISTNYIIKSISIPEEETNIDLGIEKLKYLIKKEEFKNNTF